MATQTLPNSIYLSLVREREIEWQDDTNYSKSIPIQAGKGPFGQDYVLRRMGTVWRKFNIQAIRHLCSHVGGHPRQPRA